MKKKTKQKTLWFLFLPEDEEYGTTIVVDATRKGVREHPHKLRGNNRYICPDVFGPLLGFLPKVPTKITLTWEE